MSGFTSINSLEPGTRHTTCTAPSICTMYDQWLLPVWDWTALGGAKLPVVRGWDGGMFTLSHDVRPVAAPCVGLGT